MFADDSAIITQQENILKRISAKVERFNLGVDEQETSYMTMKFAKAQLRQDQRIHVFSGYN